MDSLYKNQLSPSLLVQLACIYGYAIKDLGFACVICTTTIAGHSRLRCINNLETQSRLWNFGMANCRKHLVTCLKSKKCIPFLKIPQPNESKMDMDIFPIQIMCPCCLPEVFGDMVACDWCGKWDHQRC